MTPPQNSFKPQPLTPIGYQPTMEQRARAEAMRRFTRLYVYLPIGLGTAVVAILSLYLLYLALFPPSEETYLFLSGLADFIVVLFLIPTVLIFGLVMTAGIGGYIYYWYVLDEAERPIGPAPEYGRLRTLLWRIDSLVARLLPILLEVERRIARPLIRFHAWLAYLGAWLNNLKKLILRR